MENLSIISLDGHAQPPPEIWPQYLVQKYHEFLPALNQENKWFSAIAGRFMERVHDIPGRNRFDFAGAIAGGGLDGLFDCGIRLREMDREGIAVELITSGDPRFSGLFYQTTNQHYEMELCQAGVKAYHRWVVDEFAAGGERFLRAGIPGCAPWRGIDDLLSEMDFLAAHGFFATNLPGFISYPHQPALHDRYWDPFWARLQESGMMIYLHAGHGQPQGAYGDRIARLYAQVQREGLSLNGLVQRLSADIFEDGALFRSLKPRRALWQLMLGGVLDRFPGLKIIVSEIMGDWIDETIRFLDAAFAAERGSIAARRKPSEYWAQHFFTVLSAPRKCDIAARHAIGINAVGFGRDYPHTEGTWPHTMSWLNEVLAECSINEITTFLGQNFVGFAGLDADRIAATAKRINAPSVEALMGREFAASPDLVTHFHARSRFLADSERAERVPEMAALLHEDLWMIGR